MDSSGNHSIRLIDPYRDQSNIIPVPERLHDATLRPGTTEVVVFQRRPGYHFYAVDIDKAYICKSIATAHQRHLYGHGIFSPNGKWLYTTENNLSSLQGVMLLAFTTLNRDTKEQVSGYSLFPAPMKSK
nr:DUF1513 domain-containing protein [Endozoicomonas sp. YOMI1]